MTINKHSSHRILIGLKSEIVRKAYTSLAVKTKRKSVDGAAVVETFKCKAVNSGTNICC